MHGEYPARDDEPTGERFLIPRTQLPPGFAERLSSPPEPPAVPRPAATVALAREGARGVEVLLVRRPIASRFAADAWVFPGGAVDEEDRRLDLADRGTGPDAAWWAGRLGVSDPADAVGFVAAAVRETWEETGILLAEGGSADLWRGARAALLAGAPFGALLAEHGMRIRADRLAYIAHWITPPAEPRRYDTRFFLARVGAEAECELHGGELEEWRWARPRDAVEEFAGDAIRLLPPTVHTLRRLAGFGSLDEMWHALREASVPTHRPSMRNAEGGVEIEI